MLFFFSFQASLPCFPCALAFIIEQDLFSINVIDSGRSLVIFQRFLWNDMSKNGFSTSIETGKYHYIVIRLATRCSHGWSETDRATKTDESQLPLKGHCHKHNFKNSTAQKHVYTTGNILTVVKFS